MPTKEQKNKRTGELKSGRTKESVSFLRFSVSPFSHSSRQGRGGFIALITVLLATVSTLLIASTLIYLSSSESFSSFQSMESHEAVQIGDSCIDEGLFRLKHDVAYTGETLAIGNGSCVVTVTGSGTTRTIVASSTVSTSLGNFTRRITASTTVSTNVAGNATTTDITRWYE